MQRESYKYIRLEKLRRTTHSSYLLSWLNTNSDTRPEVLAIFNGGTNSVRVNLKIHQSIGGKLPVLSLSTDVLRMQRSGALS
jgi:hypothetical protein